MVPSVEMTASILAGGRSSRMGPDKAFLLLNGVFLLRRAIKLDPACSAAYCGLGVIFFRRHRRLGISWAWPELEPGKWVFAALVPVVNDHTGPSAVPPPWLPIAGTMNGAKPRCLRWRTAAATTFGMCAMPRLPTALCSCARNFAGWRFCSLRSGCFGTACGWVFWRCTLCYFFFSLWDD